MDLKRLARSQFGLVTRAQALQELSPAALRWRLERDSWRRVHPGVYSVHSERLDWMARASAALLFYGVSAALSMHSAAHLLGLEAREPAIVEVDTHAATQRRRRPGVRVRRRRRLPVATRRGLTVTAPAFTVIDLGDDPLASREDAVAIVARAVQRRRTTVTALADELRQRRTHRHRRALELSLGIVDAGAESVLEVDFVVRVLRAHGLPELRIAVPDASPSGRIRRDFVDDKHNVIVELDGLVAHEGRRRQDNRRDRHAAARGQITLRAEWMDVYDEACQLASDIFATLRSRGYRGVLTSCGPRCRSLRDLDRLA